MKEQKKSESIEAKATEKKVAAVPKESKEKKPVRAPKKAKEPAAAELPKKADVVSPKAPSAPVKTTPVKNTEKVVEQKSSPEPAREQSKPVQKPSHTAQPHPQRGSQSNQHHNRPQQSQHQRHDRNDGHRQHGRSRNGGSQYQSPLDRLTLDEMTLAELNQFARRYGIVGAGLMSKPILIDRIKFAQANPEEEMEVSGVLEKLPDGFGFLRSALYDYVSGPDDVYVSPSQIRRFGLRTGDSVVGVIRKPKDGEKYFALLKIKSVNESDPLIMADRLSFERLTPQHPQDKFSLEFEQAAIGTRIMDIFTPIGKGQRGLIVAPPKVGKTLLLKELTRSLIANHPEAHLIILLIDERPEEVADMRRTVKGTGAQVISSTFDEPAERHVQVAELVLEKAKRMVESGKDVVILLDSITRLARAYNTTAPASGKILTGGIDANALQWPKRFFGAARSTEEGGSLTIIATAMVDTGSRMDEVIYEEFKGTGNMEMHMTRKLSNRRIYPAFDLLISGTRREDLLHSPEDLNKVWVLQKFLSTMNTVEGMEFLIDKMRRHKTNQDFVESINRKPSGGQ
jgi:transcription termination factor Rho